MARTERSRSSDGPTDGAALLLREGAVWAADYAWAGAAHLAVPFAGGPPQDWLRGDDALPDVVLLPGVYEHWSFLRSIGEAVHRAGYRVRTVRGLGVNRLPILETGDRLARALGRLPVPAAGRIVVGHSKGGLIGKALLVRDAEPRPESTPGALAVHGVVAVATPWAGSRRARFFSQDPGVSEFLPDHPTIVTLGQASSVNGRIVSIFGPFDPHVPDGSALDGATNVIVPISGHFRILGDRATADAVLDGLRLLER